MRLSCSVVKNLHAWKLTASSKLGEFSNSSVRNFSGVLTIDEVKKKVMERMGVPKGYTALPPDRSHLEVHIPRNQDDLPPRSMKDSFESAVIPLSSDLSLQEKYSTLMGDVRKGRMLEDMDIYAVWICMKHLHNPKSTLGDTCPYTIVTANVDQISFETWNCKVTNDLRISGQVYWVGKSSMEVGVWLESLIVGQWKLFTKAFFVMAARNSTNAASAVVNKLLPSGPDEEAKYKEALDRMKKRKSEAQYSLIKTYPKEIEQKIIHDKFRETIDLTDPTLKSRILPPNSVWMNSTMTENVLFPHPEDKNAHFTVFGGQLMRLSLQLSWIIAFTFGKQRPILIHLSDIMFKSPVPMHTIFKLTGLVVYTEMNYAQIMVYCEIINVLANKTYTANTFHFTYQFHHILEGIRPLTYQEAMMWLEGRRHFYISMGRSSIK